MAAPASRGVVGSLMFEMRFWVRYLLPTKYVAVYYPSPHSVVNRMLRLADCKPSDTLYDLGCGDGRVLVAAGRLGARAVGYELDAELCQQANAAIAEAGLQDRCSVKQQDAATADVSKATIIALYLSERGNRDLMQKLAHKLQPKTRIVSNFFSIEGWDRWHVNTCTADPQTGPIHLYVIDKDMHNVKGRLNERRAFTS